MLMSGDSTGNFLLAMKVTSFCWRTSCRCEMYSEYLWPFSARLATFDHSNFLNSSR